MKVISATSHISFWISLICTCIRRMKNESSSDLWYIFVAVTFFVLFYILNMCLNLKIVLQWKSRVLRCKPMHNLERAKNKIDRPRQYIFVKLPKFAQNQEMLPPYYYIYRSIFILLLKIRKLFLMFLNDLMLILYAGHILVIIQNLRFQLMFTSTGCLAVLQN